MVLHSDDATCPQMHGGGSHHPEEHPGAGAGVQLQSKVACCGRVGAEEFKNH